MERATQLQLLDLIQQAETLLHRSLDQPEVASVIVKPPEMPPQAANDAGWAFIDYGKFYDFLRGNDMLGPKISTTEFQGCDLIIQACAIKRLPISYVAYVLATAYHETAHRMEPIPEMGGFAYFTRKYDIKGNARKARELGNVHAGDGARYAGRGFVQITGRTNYRKAGAKLGVDLEGNPDLALDPHIAARILVEGMIEGWFTARKLPDDLPAQGPATLRQFILSRDIVNGTDKDDEIAEYANDFQTGLQAGGYNVA